MSNVNIDALSVEQLEALTKDAQAKIKQKQAQGLKDAYLQFKQIAKENGTTIDEILKVGKKAQKEASVAYRDPQTPKNVWAGRGRKPGWLEEALAKGKKLEDYKVN
ncbi:H-NS histone family protein [Moraxella bovis]|uniref:H-NS histone family protein n=1 Tax=Moraxella bovis TaxID=476 RepID=UPI002225D9D0|nr:H-NS histone family protein [Moraxella bovis]UZA00352.1 H-NS histone family protein [Moraxella bovis]